MLTYGFFILYTGNRYRKDKGAFIDGSHIALYIHRELLDCTTDDPITPSRLYGMQCKIPLRGSPPNGISLGKEIHLNCLSELGRRLPV